MSQSLTDTPSTSPGVGGPDVSECSPDDRCDECGRKARDSRLAPGHWHLDHSGTCSRNSALHPCPRCGFVHADRDFGQVLACITDVPLEEGREMQRRIVDRLRGDLLPHADSEQSDEND